MPSPPLGLTAPSLLQLAELAAAPRPRAVLAPRLALLCPQQLLLHWQQGGRHQQLQTR